MLRDGALADGVVGCRLMERRFMMQAQADYLDELRVIRLARLFGLLPLPAHAESGASPTRLPCE